MIFPSPDLCAVQTRFVPANMSDARGAQTTVLTPSDSGVKEAPGVAALYIRAARMLLC